MPTDTLAPGQYFTKDSTGKRYRIIRLDNFTVEVDSDDWNLSLWERRQFEAYFTRAD